ncbi:hypothetical protein H072_8821 [Dactylellina haptotyla CBS 200.50]|uniref:Uncharacterized protein n=1 Tax=Dactylellina haptotyla (strain CBS 200.50) TaxID=1284197 RepID=S8A414_DACHA|nr:hypothetical protein H072_8821 [Dactylellina haptotyla CBS 200.50]
MLFKLLAVFCLATTGLANPIVTTTKVSCPNPTYTTVTLYQVTEWTSTTLGTTTITNGWSSLGYITSTKHETETRVITTQSTVYSPSVVTIPVTTVQTTTTAPTTTFAYFTVGSITTLPGSPPESLCLTKTCFKSFKETVTITYTYPLDYETVWSSTIGHVTTTTTVILTTTTRTVMTPGSTTALTTATSTVTYWPAVLTIATSWTTFYAVPPSTTCY